MSGMKRIASLLVISATAACASGSGTRMAASPAAPGREYVVYVASESADEVSRVVFGPSGARVESDRAVGMMPADIDGPHGLALSPSGDFYYVTIAHGTPYGTLWKIATETDSVVGTVPLGLFPATVEVTPDGQYAFVVNANFHGDHVPSSVSKVYLPSMTEVARTETCVMPHGSRINPQGTKQYSGCMMDDLLVEVDVGTGEVSRYFSVAPGREGPVESYPPRGMDHAMHEGGTVCSPTWAQPGANGERVYVACNKSNEVLEIDVADWTVTRRFATGANPYNLAVSPDGRYLLATLKNREAPATEVIELASGRTVAQVPNTTVLPHGVVVSPDSRYAFVSVEGVGAEPGKVDVIDLRSLERVGSVGVGQQAGGIAFLGMGPGE